MLRITVKANSFDVSIIIRTPIFDLEFTLNPSRIYYQSNSSRVFNKNFDFSIETGLIRVAKVASNLVRDDHGP